MLPAALAAQGSGGAGTPPSRTAEARTAYESGLAALHSFEYEDANEAFVRARQTDPSLALAYWGEAMTYHQTLWGHEDVAAGRRALDSPAAKRARAAASTSAADREWLAAADVLFGEGDGPTRRTRYADAMRRLFERHPDDPEAAAFYALSLLGTMSRSLIGTDSHEGHSEGLAGSEVQTRVGAILSRTLQSVPGHPGALHYLIHNYDDPEHARLALDAARAYAKVAPESSHAQHMPAHVFAQLGMWADAEASDRAAFAASEAWVARKQLPPTMRSYHALQWRQYELLQLGRTKDARALIDVLAPVVNATGGATLITDLSSMRARLVLESKNWPTMANERNFGNVNELAAIGFSAARAGNPALAEMARQQLARRAIAPEEGDLRPAISIMERQVSALIALGEGQRDRAVAMLTAAAAAELQLPPPLGLPIPPIPAPELLGEVLVELGRPAEALEPFRQALARNANRTRSVLGTARALAALGRSGEAREQYARVLANYANADADLPELAEVRAALQGTFPAAAPVASAWHVGRTVAVSGLAAAIALAAAWLWRRRAVAATATALPRAERRRRERGKRT